MEEKKSREYHLTNAPNRLTRLPLSLAFPFLCSVQSRRHSGRTIVRLIQIFALLPISYSCVLDDNDTNDFFILKYNNDKASNKWI